MTTTYRHLASEVGCLSAEIYKEIRRCLRLRGGVMHDGIKWIWKTSEELAERLGCHEKTIRRHLKHLVDLGWLKREQLQKRWGMRAYHYSLGDDAPLKAGVIAAPVDHLNGMQALRSDHRIQNPEVGSQMPVQTRRSDRSEADTMSGSINRNTTSTNSLPGQDSQNSHGASRQTEQFHQVAAAIESQTSKQEGSNNRVGGIRTHGPSITETGLGTFKDIATTGMLRRSDLYKNSQIKPVDALVSGTSCPAAVPNHWPVDDMTASRKVQLIEAARQLAFPGRRSRAYAA